MDISSDFEEVVLIVFLGLAIPPVVIFTSFLIFKFVIVRSLASPQAFPAWLLLQRIPVFFFIGTALAGYALIASCFRRWLKRNHGLAIVIGSSVIYWTIYVVVMPSLLVWMFVSFAGGI